VPERSYRRWQQRQRQGQSVKGPWPAPARDRVEPTAIAYADRFPAWGHRKLAMLMRVDGHHAPDATVLRPLRRSGRVQPIDYQAERRQLAEARRAAFVVPPSAPNQVWQLDFSEFETRHGGVWRIGGVADYWSKLELGWDVSTTANHRDAIETVEQAIAETERLTGARWSSCSPTRSQARSARSPWSRTTGRASSRSASPPTSTADRS
jgi:transposase InsO family protein